MWWPESTWVTINRLPEGDDGGGGSGAEAGVEAARVRCALRLNSILLTVLSTCPPPTASSAERVTDCRRCSNEAAVRAVGGRSSPSVRHSVS